jgi:histidinol-phosphatase
VNDLDVALRAADAADAVSLAGFTERSFVVEHKADASEVTAIDRATEEAITAVLRTAFPDDAIVGEEFGRIGPARARREWYVDPIDGTSNFVRGVPVWGSLIGLVVDGMPVTGVVSAPALGRRWWATHGAPAHLNGRVIRASDTASLDRAFASISVTQSWRDAGRGPALEALSRDVARVRNYGDFWQHMLVAEGALDVSIDAIGLKPYDIAALVPIVAAAGAAWSDRFGAPQWRGDTIVCANPHLHAAVIAQLTA